MAKWAELQRIGTGLYEVPAQPEPLNALTYGPWEDGTLRFYLNGKVVGAFTKEQLPYLIIRAAEVLRK